MPRLLRFPPENDSLVEVTHRCAGGQMLLRPSPAVNAIIGGVYTVAAEKYAVRVVGVVALGNHLHAQLLVSDSQARALFMQYTASNIALEINKLLGRRGHFWERRYQSSPIVGADAEHSRMRYLVSQGVKEGLVGRVVQWPGIHSAREMLSGDPIEGIWEDRTQAWELRRQGQRVARKDVTRKTTLHLAPLPSWRGLSVEERRDRVVAIIQDIEAEAAAEREKTGRAPMGAKRIRQQSPFSTPVNPVKPSRAPLFHAYGEIFIMLLQQYREFVAQFRQAAEMLKSGDMNAPFPVGSFPPGLPYVRGKPTPFSQPA